MLLIFLKVLFYLFSGCSNQHNYKMLQALNYSLLSNAKVPVRATKGSVGYDVFAYDDKIIRRGSVAKICTGIRIEMKPEIFAEFKSRSSYVLKNLSVQAGLIDPDYRGLLYVCIRNHSMHDDYLVQKNDKIAQLVFYQCIFPEFKKIEGELEETERGEGGFGSTDN